MSTTNDILTKKTWTTKQVAFIIWAAISATFVLTKIYDRFEYLEREVKVDQERETKRNNRSILDRQDMWKAIKELQNNHDNDK